MKSCIYCDKMGEKDICVKCGEIGENIEMERVQENAWGGVYRERYENFSDNDDMECDDRCDYDD